MDNFARADIFGGWCKFDKLHSQKHCQDCLRLFFDCHCSLAVHNLFYDYKKQKIVDKLFLL